MAMISCTFIAPDGVKFTSYNHCWNYIRHHWYPNIKIFDRYGKETWKISSTKNAIVNNDEELAFLRQGLSFMSGYTEMPHNKNIRPKTLVLYDTETLDKKFYCVDRSIYKDISNKRNPLKWRCFYSDDDDNCDFMKFIREN